MSSGKQAMKLKIKQLFKQCSEERVSELHKGMQYESMIGQASRLPSMLQLHTISSSCAQRPPTPRGNQSPKGKRWSSVPLPLL